MLRERRQIGRQFRLPLFDTVAGRRVLGVAVLLGALLLIIVASVRPAPFKDTRTYYAEFESAQGIGRVDRDIRVAGTNVGEIGEVRRVGDDVVAELVIEGDLPIKEDSRAELRPHTLFEGSAFIDLHPGSPSAGPLEEGTTIPRERTEVYVSLDEALRVLHEPTRDALQDLADTGAKTLRADAIEGIQRTLRAAPDLTRELGPTARALQGPEGDELAGAIQGLAKTGEAVASREASLLPLVQRARRTLAATAVDAGVPLDRTLAALPGVLERLREGGARLERVVDRIDTLAVELRPAAAALGPLLREIQPVLRDARPVLEAAPPLIADLRTVLGRAANAAPQLLRLIEILSPGTKVLKNKVLPFLNADSRLGLPAYLQLGSAFTGANASLRPYQTEAQGRALTPPSACGGAGCGEGHVLRLGSHFDSDFPGGAPLPRSARACRDLALGRQDVVRELRKAGFCG